jgi:hypothetical protein
LDVVRHGVREDVVELKTSLRKAGLALRLRPVLPSFPHSVQVLPVLLHLFLPFLLLVPPDFLRRRGGELELLLFALQVMAGEVFPAPPLFDLIQQFVLVDVLLLLLPPARIHLRHLVASTLILDVLLDQRLLHRFSLRKGTHVALHVVALVAHQHVVVLRRQGLTFL